MDEATLAQAMALADSAPSVGEAAAALRARLRLRVVAVDTIDLRDERPAARGTRRALFLGATDGHCWAVTQDRARAAGLFVADLA